MAVAVALVQAVAERSARVLIEARWLLAAVGLAPRLGVRAGEAERTEAALALAAALPV
jgi:hypothetical protein